MANSHHTQPYTHTPYTQKLTKMSVKLNLRNNLRLCVAPSSVSKEHDVMWLVAADRLTLVYVS